MQMILLNTDVLSIYFTVLFVYVMLLKTMITRCEYKTR